MKFKIYLNKEAIYKGTITCVGWSSNNEVYSCGDDCQILKWTTSTREFVQVAKIPDFQPTDFNWLISKSGSSGSGGKSNENLLISSSDGRFIILNKGARVERSVNAHNGSIIACRWAPDGSGLLSAGEDGVIKIFSRTGMLRSTVIQNEGLIVCARWSPTSTTIAYCQGNTIALKPLAANSKLIKWQAHDGLVLALSWAPNGEFLASSGEDMRYKIWDTQGTNVYTSAGDDYPITTLEFSPDGSMLAVGGFNMLKLCHHSGWSYNVMRFEDKPVGSLMNVSWSPDGTQILCGSSSGNIIFGHVVEREVIYKNLKATITGRRMMIMKDIVNNTSDTLDFSDRIIKWELGYGHLVVATPNQLHIFNENYINTPVIIDRPEVRIILLGKKNFLVVDNVSIWIYTYSGRLHLNPRYAGSQSQVFNLTVQTISMGIDVLAIRDFADQTIMHIFDLYPGASRQDEPSQVKHKQLITDIAVNRSGPSTDDKHLVAFIDTNRDLYLTLIQSGPDYMLHKIGTQVISVMWSSECNILVGLHDSCYSIWYCPGETSTDPALIALTTLSYDTTEFGKNISLVSFDGFTIQFCASGANFTITAKIYAILIHKLVSDNQWEKALKICRMGQSTLLWTCLAALASKRNQHEISEEAFSSALQIDKVDYMQFVKELDENEQMAEKAIINGTRIEEAETILLNNRKISEAIQFCLRLHRWNRALEIAQKHSCDLKLVYDERVKYMEALQKQENEPEFIKLNSQILESLEQQQQQQENSNEEY